MESVEVGEVGLGSPGSSGSGPLFAPAQGRAALGPFSLSSCTTMNRPRTYMYDGNPFKTFWMRFIAFADQKGVARALNITL